MEEHQSIVSRFVIICLGGFLEMYQMTPEEKSYLDQYNIEDYVRPSIATDIAIFSILEEGEQDNFRKLPERALKILLIKRAAYPYKDCWALPGGFCRQGEDVLETAKRELYEETSVESAYLQLAGIFGEKDRDPRGWIISHTYMALFDGKNHKLRAGSDAWEAKWFTIELSIKEQKKTVEQEEVHLSTLYELVLSHEESGVCFRIQVREHKEFVQYHEKVQYEWIAGDGLAFDHGKIIVYTILQLRKKAKHDLCLAFDLVPEYFTLAQLQRTFELILDEKLITPNFRRKIADYVLETDQFVEGERHRPAKLFKRNVEVFYS